MTIKIGVDAEFDPSAVTQGINKVTQTINQANKSQYKPVDKQALRDLDDVNKKFHELLRVNRELSRRVKATGQSGALFEQLDFKAIFPDAKVRQRQLQAINAHVGAAGGSGGGGGGAGGLGFGGVVSGMANAGLRAMGPAGNVTAGALNTGMSSGFGAGLMGLLGGMLALGVGKLVSGVMDKVGQAEDNSVALDRLKRTLGDVNVSFDGLKSVVKAGADNLKITYDEAGKLSQQFAKLGNVKGGEYGSIYDELTTGVGMSRAFGLDTSQGVGVLGQMRGIGATSDTSESKKFALLIGETIGKSGAFSKADEVMDALAGYMTSQTRQSMGGANGQGYAGLFSAMVGSGIPGLDPAGAGSMLARMNAALSGGGAMGEASQFFSAQVFDKMGLNPLHGQVLREGGMFASPDTMFGKDSAYARYMGHTGPRGSKDFYTGTRELLEQRYGGNSENDKLMRAKAFANHTGLNMNQAMSMLSLNPNQMGELSKFGDLSQFNAAGIGNLAKVNFGSDEDRRGVANSLLSRSDVSGAEKTAITEAMGKSVEEQKKVLSAIVATHDQEQSQGKDIRDSKNALDNIKTSIADKLVPYFNDARLGILYMAGGKDGKSATQIKQDMLDVEHQGRVSTIDKRFGGQLGELEDQLSDAKSSKRSADFISALTSGETSKKAAESSNEWAKRIAEINDKIAAAKEEQEKLISEENRRHQKELDDLKEQEQKRIMADVNLIGFEPSRSVGWGGNPGNYNDGKSGSVMPKGMGALASDKAFLAAIAANEKEIGAPAGLLRAQIEQESRFHPSAVSPAGAMGLAQVMPGTLKNIEKRVGRKLDPFNPQDALIIQKEVMKENYGRFGNWDDATSAYNGGWNKGTWGNPETSNYTPSIKRRMERYRREGTALPEPINPGRGSSPGGEVIHSGEMAVTVNVNTPNGKQVVTQSVPTRVKSNWNTEK